MSRAPGSSELAEAELIEHFRRARRDSGSALGTRRRPLTAARGSGTGRRSPAVRSASAAPRARGRDVARRAAVAGHPAPARACRPCDHIGVVARDRQHRDRSRRSRAASSDYPGPQQAVAPVLKPHAEWVVRPFRRHPDGAGAPVGCPASITRTQRRWPASGRRTARRPSARWSVHLPDDRAARVTGRCRPGRCAAGSAGNTAAHRRSPTPRR